MTDDASSYPHRAAPYLARTADHCRWTLLAGIAVVAVSETARTQYGLFVLLGTVALAALCATVELNHSR